MRDLADGEVAYIQGSGKKPYELKNVGGVYSCSCPAWRNQSDGIEARTCKHLKQLRGEAAELARVGGTADTPKPAPKESTKTPPPILLAHTWENDSDPAGWWMSEKLDGVRAWWDGTTFWSRDGNEYRAPESFTKDIPKVVLDGELWVGRKKFQTTVSIVRRHDRGPGWEDVSFVVFDAPMTPGAFEERVAAVDAMLANGPSHVRAHVHECVRDAEHVKDELARVEALGGEGVMLRQPGSLYEQGRSTTLYKLKSFKDDEAEVVGYTKGKGRHKGRVGALEARWANGIEFSIGTGLSDKERNDPPPLGTIVTFRYQELTDEGKPRFPSYVGIRHD